MMMACILRDQHHLCVSTRPRIKLYERKYNNVFHVVAEIAKLIVEQKCVYDKLIMYEIIFKLLNSSSVIKSIILNSLVSFLNSAASIDCFESPSLISAQAIAKKEQKKINGRLQKTNKKPRNYLVNKNNLHSMQSNHNGVAEYGNYKNYETNSIVTINKYDVDMQYKSPIVFTITGRDYFNRQIDLPTNRNLFNKLTLRELGESIGLNKPISTLFRKLGLSNSIFCTNEIDLRIPI